MSTQERLHKNEPGHAKTETSTTRAGEHVRARTPVQKRTRARENERDTASEHLRARTHTQNENGHANAKRARMCARKRHGLAKTSARARLRENEPEQAIENVHMPASEAGPWARERDWEGANVCRTSAHILTQFRHCTTPHPPAPKKTVSACKKRSKK